MSRVFPLLQAWKRILAFGASGPPEEASQFPNGGMQSFVERSHGTSGPGRRLPRVQVFHKSQADGLPVPGRQAGNHTSDEGQHLLVRSLLQRVMLGRNLALGHRVNRVGAGRCPDGPVSLACVPANDIVGRPQDIACGAAALVVVPTGGEQADEDLLGQIIRFSVPAEQMRNVLSYLEVMSPVQDLQCFAVVLIDDAGQECVVVCTGLFLRSGCLRERRDGGKCRLPGVLPDRMSREPDSHLIERSKAGSIDVPAGKGYGRRG